MSSTGGADTRPLATSARLVSLDVFRGLVVAAMIVVNAPGEFAPKFVLLEHMPWNGWTPTDLIFPSFLFIVGVAIPFAYGGKLARGTPRRELLGKALLRSAALVGMGLLGGISVDSYGSFRFTGVLQRIGLCYLAASVLFLFGRPRIIVASAAAALAGYWLLLTRVPVPGYGAGNLSAAGNLASFIDRRVLGSHMANAVYDSEGLLSTIPAAVTSIFGVLAGAWLRTERTARAKALGLAAAGAAGVGLGLLWGRWFPINKHLYTSSFALFASGAGFCLLALLYWLVDLRQRRAWCRPFQTFGVHALLAYCGSSLVQALLEQGHVAVAGRERVDLVALLRLRLFGWLHPASSSLAWSLTWLLLWFGVVNAAIRLQAWLKSRRTEPAPAPLENA